MLAVAVVAGYANREKLALRIKSVYVPVTPKASQTAPPSKRRAGAVRGDAPWALSALPECFLQTAKDTGPAKWVLSQIPHDMSMVRPPARLAYADCTLRIVSETAYVDRGGDHLRIPPPVRIYTGPGALALLRGEPGGYELRIYATR